MPDFEDIPMDNVPTLTKEDEDAVFTQQMEEDAYEQAIQRMQKEQETHLDELYQLLTTSSLNSWERGFCESCHSWLSKSPANRLSVKQKEVLAKTVAKHIVLK